MAKKYYSRSEKEKLAKKLATVVAVFVIVCTATVVIGHIVDVPAWMQGSYFS